MRQKNPGDHWERVWKREVTIALSAKEIMPVSLLLTAMAPIPSNWQRDPLCSDLIICCLECLLYPSRCPMDTSQPAGCSD